VDFYISHILIFGLVVIVSSLLAYKKVMRKEYELMCIVDSFGNLWTLQDIALSFTYFLN